MIIGYARVSSQNQADTEALNQQMARLSAAGAQQIFYDIESGRKENRKNLTKVLHSVEEGKVKQLIVTRIDRLGRSVIGLSKTIAVLEKHKCHLRVLDQPVDTNNAFGWLSLNQIMVLAEFESRLMSDRINHGMDFRRESGKYFFCPYGYEKKEGLLVPHPTEWEPALDQFQIYLTTGNLRKTVLICHEKWGKEWTPQGFSRWLLNPACRGHTVYNRFNEKELIYKYNTHAALITSSEYEQILFLMKKQKQKWGCNGLSSTASEYALAGKIICGICNRKCYRRIRKSGTQFIKCRNRDKKVGRCSNNKTIEYPVVEDAVIDALLQKTTELEAIALKALNHEESPDLLHLRQQLKKLEEMGDNPAIEIARVGLRSQIIELQKLPDPPENLDHFQNFKDPEYWRSLDDDEKRKIMSELVEKVVVKMGKVVKVVLKI